MIEHRGESFDSRQHAFTRRKLVRAQAYRASTARKRTLGRASAGSNSGDRSIPWLCSRGVWVAEVDEQRLVPTASHAARQREGRGLAGRLSLRGGSAGEAALKPGRSGESHEHASSETGRLLMIPCVVRASAERRGRGLSSMEGVLIR